MKRRNAIIGVALFVVSAVVLVVVLNIRSAPQGEESALLAHFGVSPEEYAVRHNFLERPLLWDANPSLMQVSDQWYQSVHKVGDGYPTWFVGRDGVFVVVQRPDGSLVGTRWLAVGGRTRLSICKGDDGQLCGITLKRVGVSWIMGTPETRGPLP